MDALNAADQVDFHLPILKPSHFHGRKALLDGFLRKPWRVLILLGGRGMGKSSVLNQFDHHLKAGTERIRMLPVALNLNSEKPGNTEGLLHLLLSRLEDVHGGILSGPIPETVTTSVFESQLNVAIDRLRVCKFSGVCFLLDECEQLVGQTWWKDDASGFLRSLLESPCFATRVGFVLTGFRALRDHRQKVGSRLMHEADWEYLAPLALDETAALVIDRCGPGNVSQEEIAEIHEHAGGHPKLAQRLVTRWIDTRSDDSRPSIAQLAEGLRDQLGELFEDWWGENGYSGGLTETERAIYHALLSHSEISVLAAAEHTRQSEHDARQALQILKSVGLIIPMEYSLYRVGTRIFAEWARVKVSPLIEKKTRRPKRGTFDVFLCHNSQDKSAVKIIGERLKELEIRPWLDEWELRPGMPWQKSLEDQIQIIRAAAVFVGPNGIGPWQDMEQAAFLREFVNRTCPVIPAVLSECKVIPKLPIFLAGMTWVDFRKAKPDPLKRLIWGITGKKADQPKRGR